MINVANNILQNMISYFWQPNMDSRYRYNMNDNSSPIRPWKEIDKEKALSLDNIMILRTKENEIDYYNVTMYGLRQDNCDKRILLSSGNDEIALIDTLVESNLEMERMPIKRKMTIEEIDSYNSYLEDGNYHECLRILISLELTLNYKNSKGLQKKKY